MKVQAVIFDMDGVLIDSLEPHYETWSQTAAELGLQPLPREEFAGLFGRGFIDFARAMGAGGWPAEKLDAWHRAKEKRYREVIGRDLAAYAMPGVEALLNNLAAAGLRLAVASSGARGNVELIVNHLPGGQNFSVWTSGDEVAAAKPAPDVFLKTAEKLNLAPAACAVVEDSVHGLLAARAAGMATIAITTTSPREELAPRADVVVDSLAEIAACAVFKD